ncbi:MAG: Xaa-Pro dipeptidase [Thermoplasmata archaeon]|nr:MAG: Xaa-Pro dipeptidase [Thermoplasmata archaeon]
MENPKRYEKVYRRRIKRLTEKMEEKGAGLYIVTAPGNIRYLCCHTFPKEPPLTHLIITAEGERIGIASSLEGFRAQEMTAVDEVRTFCTYRALKCRYKTGIEGVRDLIKERSPEKVLTDGRLLSRRCRVERDSTIQEMRAIKEKEEIEAIRKATKVVDSGYRFLREFLQEGLTELEVVRELNHHLRGERGVANLSFETIVASGPHAAYSHHDPSERVVRRGDAVICDFGVVVDGYCSDMTRTFIIGENSKLVRIYQVVLKAQKAALERVRAGDPLKDLDLTARGIIEREGFGVNYPHSLGHGVGLEVHEEPLGIRPTIKGEQKEGMVITIEPGVYVPGLGGVRIEDDVLITPQGGVLLTQAERDPHCEGC